MENCPCKSEKAYENCCLPFHEGTKQAQTAESLMKTRYSAFAKHKVQYIVDTHAKEGREEINPEEIEAWAKSSNWLGIDILSTNKGLEEDTEGMVEFKAYYEAKGSKITHHEKASFAKENGQWFFVDGEIFNEAIKRSSPKVGRNDPCPCGSGKKHKKCCLAA